MFARHLISRRSHLAPPRPTCEPIRSPRLATMGGATPPLPLLLGATDPGIACNARDVPTHLSRKEQVPPGTGGRETVTQMREALEGIGLPQKSLPRVLSGWSAADGGSKNRTLSMLTVRLSSLFSATNSDPVWDDVAALLTTEYPRYSSWCLPWRQRSSMSLRKPFRLQSYQLFGLD